VLVGQGNRTNGILERGGNITDIANNVGGTKNSKSLPYAFKCVRPLNLAFPK